MATTEDLAFEYKGYRVKAFTSPCQDGGHWTWVSFDCVKENPIGPPRYLVPGTFQDQASALVAADGYARTAIDQGKVGG